MAGRVSARIGQLVAQRKLIRSRVTKEMILKEIEAAENDLKEAEDSLGREKYKWTTIQGYYSAFHSARALLYSKGFREKSHYALLSPAGALLGRVGQLTDQRLRGSDEPEAGSRL